MTTQFTLGSSIRSWVTFEIKDATEDEIATIIAGNDEAAVALARKLHEAGRLEQLSIDYEDMPEFFAEHADPSILDLTVTS